MQVADFITQADALSAAGEPFLFLIDFEMQQPLLWLPHEASSEELLFSINGFTNAPTSLPEPKEIALHRFPMSITEYRASFDQVIGHVQYGNSFLTNLTVKTKIELNTTLQDLFFRVRAPYCCWLRNQFLFFSPESFIKITNGKIRTFPMKGTIDARIPDAATIILEDGKEMAEHVTIVDLLRNDLSRVAADVWVSRFRYLEEVKTNHHPILQVSSEIIGEILPAYKSKMGSLLMELLPAGSVSGAPKDKTMAVIRSVEKETRGYYTGVFGYFDGENLDSGVNIRYIEQQGESLYYRSGGGLTARSDWKMEYEEVIQKIYVPLD
mgnify:CR=1 FL=1